MICPKCKLDTLNEEKDMVICSNCGFKTTRREYNIWKKIYDVRPRRREKTVFHENENGETYTGTYIDVGDRSIPVIIIVLFFVILMIIIVSML